MDIKKKVYLSSTFIDLIEHRKAVKEALERARVVIEMHGKICGIRRTAEGQMPEGCGRM